MNVRWLAFRLGAAFLWAATCFGAVGNDDAVVRNGGFEKVMAGGNGPEGWTIGIARNTKATIQLDGTTAHSGRYSIRIADQSPTRPFVYAVIQSPKIAVRPETTYDIRFFAKAQNTTANVPMMGWVGGDDPKYVWLTEYAFSHLVSEYGKFIPGSDLDCNVSVHSAIRPNDSVFRQKPRNRPSRVSLEKNKIYISFSIMEGVDALNYWQGYQRKMWADPLRGKAPMGFGMNPMLHDVMPLVQQYYYETMTPNETFFAMVYLNEPVYASRFRKEDRERIWSQWLRSMDEYCRKLDMDGVEVCWSGIGRRNLPKEGILGRYSRGLKGLNYIIADCGSGNRVPIPSDACTYMLDDKVVFHTLNQYHVWSANENMHLWPMDRENTRTLEEVQRLLPKQRPAFISIVGTSWVYKPSWVADLQKKLPPDFVLVSPGDLARLFRESLNERAGESRKR